MRDLDACDDVVRFHSAHDASLDKRRVIFRAFELGDAVDLGDPHAIGAMLDLFAKAAGYGKLVVGWQSIEEPRALAALNVLVRFDQAYASELIAAEAATALIADFAALFPAPRTWHTNASFTEETTETGPQLMAKGWYGFMTGATFDTGLAVLSAQRIGMLWFADED